MDSEAGSGGMDDDDGGGSGGRDGRRDGGGGLGAGEVSGTGYIVLAATPIGNTGDASARLVEWLSAADLVAAEDTRRLHRLVQSLGVEVKGRIVSYHEHNEAARTAELLAQVQQGKTLLMVTDAGMPAVSDPGFRLVEAAVAAGSTRDGRPRPVRGVDGAGTVRAAHRPVLL